ncbi:MAG: DMT family transporter [Patescibacteria group bacterium]|nr:DMT family transporter [Patescibacteria group bacterium]
MPWQVLAVSIPLLFVAYQALSKLLPSGTSAFLVNAYASALGAVIMLALYFLTSAQKTFTLDGRTLAIALGIGALISIGNAGIIQAYLWGAPQSSFTAIYYPLLVIYALVVSIIIWHEKLNWYQIAGILLALTGIVLIVYFRR